MTAKVESLADFACGNRPSNRICRERIVNVNACFDILLKGKKFFGASPSMWAYYATQLRPVSHLLKMLDRISEFARFFVFLV